MKIHLSEPRLRTEEVFLIGPRILLCCPSWRLPLGRTHAGKTVYIVQFVNIVREAQLGVERTCLERREKSPTLNTTPKELHRSSPLSTSCSQTQGG